ncbi:MAG: mandelate racemase/muconate lactonizing enzyme family protein [Asticcacaulis sp.]
MTHKFQVEGITSAIKSVGVEYYRVPLAETLSDASHGDHTHFELILCRIRCADGVEGVGYTYTGGVGGRGIYSLLNDDIRPMLLGRDASELTAIWDELTRRLHYVGRGGLVSFAISAVDIALWDIHCKRANLPLWKALGGTKNYTQCYAGFIDIGFSEDKLVRNAADHIAKGFKGIKIKVGKEDYREDVRRVAAVREAIGPDSQFMVDANYSYTVDDAIGFGQAIAPYNVHWFEEPTNPDDLAGYAKIADAISVPLAMGENLHTQYEFEQAVRQAKLTFLQPDSSNIGGITGWLKVARLAERLNMPVCSHGIHELHVSLMAAQPHAGSMEVHSFPIDQYTTTPFKLVDGLALAPDVAGTGVCFSDEKLKSSLVLSS